MDKKYNFKIRDIKNFVLYFKEGNLCCKVI